MRKLIILFFLFVAFRIPVIAEEGMWIPVLLQQVNIRQMQDMGLKLSAEDIYSINQASLKDAIVQFGSGCTGAFVSEEGLLFTNHHCGLGSIQRLSSPEHNYLSDGFWAKSKEEELPCPGLTVTLLVRMEDVSNEVLRNVNDTMTENRRSQVIKKNIAEIEKSAVKGTSLDAKVRAFYSGNQYYLFVSEIYKDVRFVGAPPSGIGQFGGDTDNWMWPRHGADFSVFRVYAGKDNKPAAYAKENAAYRPKKFFPVSLKGYREGDFTFVFGYPGTTREYLPSCAVDLVANYENPVRINLRRERLDILDQAMKESELVRIQYTSKHQGIANGWKKMTGESMGVKKLDAVSKKQEFEKLFQAWADSVSRQQTGSSLIDPASGIRHPEKLLPEFEKVYREFQPADIASVYLNEAGMGIEIVRFANGFADLVKKSKDKGTKPEELTKTVQKVQEAAAKFYKDYQPAVDRKVFTVMIREMIEKMDREYLPDVLAGMEKKFRGNYDACAAAYFDPSFLPDSTRMSRFLREFTISDCKKLEKDPLYILTGSIYSRSEKDLTPRVRKFTATLDSLQRLYMAGQMAMGRHRFYPDANSTLRVTYGRVKGFKPADAVNYLSFTTSNGILQKEDPSVYDYAIHPGLKKLFQERDFGDYADRDGMLHIAFIATNHTSGGNSGSPVLDAAGNLIGLNFDRNWEGTVSDLMYDPDQCRNITLDIRYCLLLIDKFAGAKRLISEMNIIR
jgi:hypothetical protein